MHSGGTMHGSRRIPKEQEARILRLWAGGLSKGGMSFTLIAERYNVDEAYIRRIVKRQILSVECSSGFTYQSCGY